ncbi:unnamed protein product (macronuclear) [Paramecium tetraurelia]|uniref:Histidine kinase n=1 Tax=Paramecium tetraurelia TaxID=5888 RepID=A0C879_PARTE|nr:uncharacterized protein GSPATT00036127001 [Paramecium tetraurelia]CAK66996.1 unnamed protein product [Paramecium tetraurelia]|eukprot:XP_001434393.1 hypothetical protein (macronuclear) [Paramecium tetraurelia strain d4-2]
MQLKTKLLLTQLILSNLISLIRSGSQETKDLMTITLNSIGLLLDLIIFCSEYAKQKQNLINIQIQINIIVQLETLFYDVQNTNNYFTVIYLLLMQIDLKKQHQCYQFLTHTICLYVFTRLAAQFYVQFTTSQFILFVLWQPLNHLILYKEKSQNEIRKPSPTSQSQRQPNHNAHFSYMEQCQQNLIDENTPHIDRNINVALDEDLLNYLPYGLVLIDTNLQVIKHNEKLMSYLMINQADQILNHLDQLLSNAQLNSIKSSPHTKHKPHIVPLRKLKQNSASQYQYNTGIKSNSANWLSDRLKVNIQNKGSFKSSIQEAGTHSYIQFVMSEFLNKSFIKINPSENLSMASDQTRMFKFHVVKDLKVRKKHFQIKVYEVKLQTKTKDIAFLFIIENITNKEELKELTSRFKFQQALLNSFSHELRTPLNSSLPLLQILSKKIDDTLNDNYLQLAIVSCRRLLFQINDILDYAQIECEDFKLNSNNFLASDIFDDLKELFQQECSQKQIELILNYNSQITIYSDKLRITQILVNLLNNSIKFTKQGGRIVLSLKKRVSQCIFSVWDNGEGISNEEMLTLSNQSMYYQLGSNKMGLGLRVSKGIAKFLGGDGELQIKSEKGFYTIVSFSIEESVSTMMKDEDSSIRDIEELGSDTKNSAQRVYISSRKFLNHCECNQILIVDDVPFNHITLIALLQNYGYKADSAYDGDSAIKKVRQRQQNICCKAYKIIFMDIEMPGKNGFTTSSEISKLLQNERQKSIIVMCSAYNGLENAELAHQSGMNEIISKPISLDSLQTLLGKYFC